MPELSATDLTITERPDKGDVVFGIGDRYAFLPPDQGMAVCEALKEACKRAGGISDIIETPNNPGMSEERIDKIRIRLKARVTKMITNLIHRKIHPKKIADELVDICLREVL